MLIGIGFLISFLLIMTNPADNRKVNNESILNNAEGGVIDGRDPQFAVYSNLMDSFNRIREWNKNRLRGTGAGVSTPFFGVRHIFECDSCNSFDSKKFKSEYKNKYFTIFWLAIGWQFDGNFHFLSCNFVSCLAILLS